MIKQFFDYKMNDFNKLLSSSVISDSEKKKIMDDYSRFLSYFKQDDNGRVIISKKLAREMFRLLKEGKIPYIIDEYDLGIVIGDDMPNSIDYQFSSISDFVAVHKSAISPTDDTIFTRRDSGVTDELSFVDPSTGINHHVPYLVGSDTIHFTLNCPVSNHEYGNDWDSYKYAVMINLSNLDKDKILDVKSEDTYIDGSCTLGSEYVILCPLGEKDKVLNNNPNARVVEYSGISLNDAIVRMLIYSQKKVEPYGTYGWGRDSDFLPVSSDNKILDGILEREGYPNLVGVFGPALHSETKYMARRMWQREYEALISLIKYNKENGIDMPDEVLNMVLIYGGAYSVPGNVLVSIDIYKEYVFPILEKYGYDVSSDFFDGINLSDSGMKIINNYPSDMGMVPCIQCPDWENEFRKRVIKLIKDKEYGSNSCKK